MTHFHFIICSLLFCKTIYTQEPEKIDWKKFTLTKVVELAQKANFDSMEIARFSTLHTRYKQYAEELRFFRTNEEKFENDLTEMNKNSDNISPEQYETRVKRKQILESHLNNIYARSFFLQHAIQRIHYFFYNHFHSPHHTSFFEEYLKLCNETADLPKNHTPL